MLNRKEYLIAIRDQITCEADEQSFWNAYSGSHKLASATWQLYERRGKAMGVPPEVAGYMMQNGVGSAEACAVFGVRKRVMIG